MKKETIIFIEHILECIEIIESYAKGVKEQDFLTDLKLQDAIIRRLEIIGEAVKNIPKSTQAKYPDVMWKEMAGMRDVLIHHYFGISLKITWKILEKDIVPLKKQILRIKKDLSC